MGNPKGGVEVSAPGASALRCPNCGSEHVSIGASGNAICPDCGHLWLPTDAPIPEVLAPVPDVLTSDDGLAYVEAAGNPETYADRQAELIGGAVLLEGGQLTELVAWTDDEGVVVRLGNNDLEKVALADVERIMPPIPEVEPVQLPETEDELSPDLALALKLARVIVGAGAESLYRRDRAQIAELPPTGFLPTEPELLPVIEQACGLAMAMLIEAFELDADDVIAWADIESETTDVAATDTEGDA